MLIDEFKKQNMEALKARDVDKRSILSVVITKYVAASIEAKAKGKEFGDSDMLVIISKVLKELDEEKEGYLSVNNSDRVKGITYQQEVLKGYLPTMLSEDEIRKEIEKLDDKSIPSVMKHFKTNFAGKVDMSLVAKITKSFQ